MLASAFKYHPPESEFEVYKCSDIQPMITFQQHNSIIYTTNKLNQQPNTLSKSNTFLQQLELSSTSLKMQFTTFTAAIVLSAISLTTALPAFTPSGRVVARDNADIDCINQHSMKSDCGLTGDDLNAFSQSPHLSPNWSQRALY